MVLDSCLSDLNNFLCGVLLLFIVVLVSVLVILPVSWKLGGETNIPWGCWTIAILCLATLDEILYSL